MPQDLFPDPGPDDGEPDGFPVPPAAEGDGPGVEQGLFVCLPAEQLTLAGFAQGGQADTMAPGRAAGHGGGGGHRAGRRRAGGLLG